MLQILLLDGGLGTTLEAPPYNIRFTTDTPLWSSHLLVSDPSTLRAAHRAFVTAGADILLTATYQTSFQGFTKTNPNYTNEDAARFMRSAIPLARSASASGTEHRPSGRVALSLGPYGATMTPVSAEYTGLYPAEMDGEKELRNWHAQRLRVFADNDCPESSWDRIDYVAFETLRRKDEVRAVRGAMQDLMQSRGQDRQCLRGDRKPWWVCGVFPAEEVDEDDVRQWVDAAMGGEPGLPRPWGIGINCTRIELVSKIVSIMQDELRILSERKTDGFLDEWESSSGKPWLVLYPDGTKGEKYDPSTKTWVTTKENTVSPPWDETYWNVIQNIPDGAWEGAIIGGCCRAGPAEIAALRQRIDAGKNNREL